MICSLLFVADLYCSLLLAMLLLLLLLVSLLPLLLLLLLSSSIVSSKDKGATPTRNRACDNIKGVSSVAVTVSRGVVVLVLLQVPES